MLRTAYPANSVDLPQRREQGAVGFSPVRSNDAREIRFLGGKRTGLQRESTLEGSSSENLDDLREELDEAFKIRGARGLRVEGVAVEWVVVYVLK